MRRRALAALGGVGALAACRSTQDPSEGLVSVPMAASASASASADELDASPDARDAAQHGRPVVEPHPPTATNACTRNVRCQDPLFVAPPWPYVHPYERCDPNPQDTAAHLSAQETDEHRKDDPETCCYVSFDNCSRRPHHGPRVVPGRPLRDGDAIIVSEASERCDWVRMDVGEGDGDVQYWLRAAALEHASIAEFARISLELMSLGAPADLVRDTHRAALDEIEHARICYGEASRALGRTVGPSPLAVPSEQRGAADLARRTLVDGCINEAAACLELRERARSASARIAKLLGKMADDEERHAELAWRTLRFLVDQDAVHDVASALSKAERELESTPLADAVVRPCLQQLMAHARRSPRAGGCALAT